MTVRTTLEEIKTESQEGTLPPNLRPTLAIGLGGTGHRIILQLKGQLLKAYGAVPERYIRLLAFDTADESLSTTVHGKVITLEADREFFHIGHTPVPNIVRNLERQPAIANRLPAIQNIPAVALRNGARQLRPLGLLALLWRVDEVEQRLSDAIWALAGKESLGRREGQTQGINVFICNSLVGGTGSGTFLDIAYLVRALFAELGSMGDFCYITGVGVLPQAFRGIEGPNLIPNAVAALKELSHGMLRGGFTCQYSNGRWIEALYPPFDIYYLVDGVDEQGYTWQGLSDLAAMIAAGIFLQIGSQVGLKGENDFDNLSDVLSRQTPEGEGTFCGSFGMATLSFPAKSIAAWCTANLASQMLDRGLLRAEEEAVAAPEPSIHADLPEAEPLLQALAQDEEGTPLLVDPEAALWLQQRSQVPAEIIRYIHDYQHARVEGDYRAQIRSNGTALAHKLRAALAAQMAQRLQDPKLTIRGRSTDLQALKSLIARRSTRIEMLRSTAENESQRASLDLAAQEEALRQAGNGFFLWRRRALAEAKERYLKVATATMSWQLQISVCDVALATLSEFGQEIALWENRLTRLQAALARAAQHFNTEAEEIFSSIGDRTAVADISLADAAYSQTLYQRYAPPISQVLADLLHVHILTTWGDLPLDEILAALRGVASRPFLPLQQMTVEDALQDRTAEDSPEAYRARLFRLAAPSWNLDLTRLEDGGAYLQTLQVLGVPDEANSLFQEQMRMLVSTHDPETVIAFVATLGAPFSALQQYPDYARSYQGARRLRPLHVLPQFQAEGEQAQLAFALGIIYELIFSRGFYFYYRSEDPLDAPVKLDNGLANAIHRFAQNESLVQETLARVEQRIAETGTMAALEKLAAYYTTEGKGHDAGNNTDPLVTTMRKLVRTYADELRSTQQALGAG